MIFKTLLTNEVYERAGILPVLNTVFELKIIKEYYV